MNKLCLLLFISIAFVSCKKELPETLHSGKYVWIHSYNNSNQSQSFQTMETTYEIKIKANGSFKIFENNEKLSEGVCTYHGGNYPLKLGSETGTNYWFRADEDQIEVLDYPISGHINTFTKL